MDDYEESAKRSHRVHAAERWPTMADLLSRLIHLKSDGGRLLVISTAEPVQPDSMSLVAEDHITYL